MRDQTSRDAARQWLDQGANPAAMPLEIFRAYVDAQTESIVWMDKTWNIIYANQAFLTDFGVTWDEVEGTSMLNLVEGEAREALRGRLERAMELTPEQPTRTEDFAGEKAWLSSLFTAYFSSDGELVVLTDEARDHTDKRETLRALEATNRRLTESNRDLQDFAYIASHDLQEPLRKISAFGDRLATKYADSLDDRGLDYLARIRSASGRMQTLIDAVLTFSRVSTHGAPSARTELNAVVSDVLDDLELAIQECDAVVDVGALPVLAADETQLRQLFQNLIGNALKFRKADVAPHVTVSAVPGPPPPDSGIPGEPDGWLISVADNGIGFDPKYRDKIFTVFQRLHSRTEYEGSGVGLAVCRRIAERHGGALRAVGQEGEGAEFHVWLPKTPPEPMPKSDVV